MSVLKIRVSEKPDTYAVRLEQTKPTKVKFHSKNKFREKLTVNA